MPPDFLIHPDRISTRPLVWEGRFAPRDLERLEETVAADEGELRYRITAVLDPQRRKTVSCIIEGFVFLTCQTSLEAFRHDLSISERLVLVDSEDRLPRIEEESDAEDYLVADEPLDIRDLVEDAVLLSLPMVPRKPGLGEAPGGTDSAAREPSPFAALAGLKRKQ
ncbi:MAG TPA: YceD family protein [Usitatibacter sp.]|nr:YceD family protein [Usitatibacter sp.]